MVRVDDDLLPGRGGVVLDDESVDGGFDGEGGRSDGSEGGEEGGDGCELHGVIVRLWFVVEKRKKKGVWSVGSLFNGV